MTSCMNKSRLIVAALFLLAFTTPIKSQQGWVATRIAPADQDLNAAVKSVQLSGERSRAGPAGSLESRTASSPAQGPERGRAVSTQLFAPVL